MEDKQKQYFELMASLETHPGLKFLLDDLDGMRIAIAAGWQSLTPETLRYEQGRYAGISQAVDYFTMLDSIKKQAELEDAPFEEFN